MSLQHQKIQQKPINKKNNTNKPKALWYRLSVGHEDQCLTQVQLQGWGCVIAK